MFLAAAYRVSIGIVEEEKFYSVQRVLQLISCSTFFFFIRLLLMSSCCIEFCMVVEVAFIDWLLLLLPMPESFFCNFNSSPHHRLNESEVLILQVEILPFFCISLHLACLNKNVQQLMNVSIERPALFLSMALVEFSNE